MKYERLSAAIPVRCAATARVALPPNGQFALSWGLPSSCLPLPRRIEHMCAPFFLQQSGRSEETVTVAIAERTGAPANSSTRRSEVRRRCIVI